MKSQSCFKGLICAAVMIAGGFAAGGALFANDFNVWVSPEYNLSNGDFSQTTKDNRDRIITSQEFEDKFISKIGLGAGFGWRFISLEGKFGWSIPKSVGNIIQDDYNTDNQDIIKAHKEFSNSLDAENCDIDTKLRFDIPVIRNWLNIQPYMGFKYNYSKYSGAFSSGHKGLNDTYDYRASKYSDKYAWNMFTTDITDGKDIWLKRELFDLSLGTTVHGTLFDRFFVDADFAVSPVTWLNNKEYNGSRYYLDMMKGFFRRWSFGAAGGVYLGKQKEFEIGLNFRYNILNSISGQSYTSGSENSGFEKVKEGTFTSTNASSGRTSSETFYGSYGWTEAKNWQIGIFGKYRFTFGPTHTPRARAAREKKEKAPKVRDGKVNVKVY